MQASPALAAVHAFADGPLQLEDIHGLLATASAAINQERMLEALELVASKPKTCGVYILDEQDMRFVRSALQGVGKADRLAAAAPHLLMACKRALYALKGREHDGFLREAIAKATGAQS